MKTNFATVYESIGYLFYAISKTCEQFSQEELAQLNEVISQKWRPMLDCSQKYHLDTAETVQLDLIDHLHSAVRKAHECQMSRDAAFEHFKQYYRHHTIPFNDTIKETVLSTCKSLGKIFSGNDDPANRLDRLHEVRQLLGQKLEPPRHSLTHINP
jgi:hypothetical protein